MIYKMRPSVTNKTVSITASGGSSNTTVAIGDVYLISTAVASAIINNRDGSASVGGYFLTPNSSICLKMVDTNLDVVSGGVAGDVKIQLVEVLVPTTALTTNLDGVVVTN